MEKIYIEEKLKDIVSENIISFIADEGIPIQEYFQLNEEKERNLLINLTKYLIEKNKDENYKFSDEEIKKYVLLKKVDYQIYKDIFFQNEEEKFILKENIKLKISLYLDNNHKYSNSNKNDEFKSIYFKLKDMLDARKYNYDKFSELIKQGINFAKELHWKYLPIYNEQTMKNRGSLPENNIEKYYNHYHTIEDLYQEISGKGIKSNIMNGDITLEKEINFKVYTARWNGYDTYKIFRTIYGWNVYSIGGVSETLKNGKGGLFDSLHHDSIFFPEAGVAYALETIWELADTGQLSYIELEVRLQEIAEWISDVERNMRVKQPKWCNYY